MQLKTMLDKQNVMFSVIRKIVMIFYNELFCPWIWIFNVGIIPSITNVDQNGQLEWMPVHFLDLIEVHENIVFYKVYDKHDIIMRESFQAYFILFFLETCYKIMQYKFMQFWLGVGKKFYHNGFFIL